MRTIIDLPSTQLEALDRWRQREGLSRAEAVRRAIAAHIETTNARDARQAFGLWKAKPVDALAHERALRGEWAPPTPPRKPRR